MELAEQLVELAEVFADAAADITVKVFAEILLKVFTEVLAEIFTKILTAILKVKASLIVHYLGFSVS